MEPGASVWMVVLSVAAAWLTVVCLILARVPRLPNILDDVDEEPEVPVPTRRRFLRRRRTRS
ncbi:hypothetical protein AB0N65_10290 [Paenarthrobacter sp. NPDC089322]|uniref:hypothetical protein n=1 Tax=Paenarthrobacter sp. NPDC089322 TaxID=3155065 RepID=UPI0034393110